MHCRECPESNIGLVIKSLIFPALIISSPTERLARSSHSSRGSAADEQNVVVVVCQENVKIISEPVKHDWFELLSLLRKFNNLKRETGVIDLFI